MIVSRRHMPAAFAGLMLAFALAPPAAAEVTLSGTFTASRKCQAFQSIRAQTNPGWVKVRRNRAYPVIAKNKTDATYYRILIDDASPKERWVSASCGDVAEGAATASVGTAARQSGKVTHLLSLSWEPTFCIQHSDKSECREMTATSFSATHLSLHGLWPQPRYNQYCNVPPNLKAADKAHDWNSLPEPDMTADTRRRLAGVMPGVQSKLPRHEWIVHGTCYGTNADSYFARATELTESVDQSAVAKLFADNAGQTLTAEAIRASFDQAFGAGAGERVFVTCDDKSGPRRIAELRLNLAGDVTGRAGLGDLMRAAPPSKVGCPAGLVTKSAN